MTRFEAGRGLRSALAWTAAGCGAARSTPLADGQSLKPAGAKAEGRALKG